MSERYSQNDEQDVLLAHFGDKADGRFLDVGAYNGRDFSNVLALAERGWSGVCVEPSPRPFLDLMDVHKQRPGVELANVAVAAEPGLTTFYDCGGDAVSTLDPRHAAKWSSAATYRRFTVAAVTVPMLLTAFPGPYHLLNVDVEGQSAELLTRFPIGDMHDLSCICVEHDGHWASLGRWLAGWGFREVSRNAENAIYTR